MTPYYQRDGIVIYHGDCLALLPALPSGSVDAVVTDPPYGVEIDSWDGRVPHELCPEFHRLATGTILWFGAAAQHRNDLTAFDPPPQRIVVWNPAFTLSKTMASGMAYRWHPVYCWRLPKSHSGPSWDVWRHNCDGRNWWNHSCTKPIALIVDAVRTTGDALTVLDPFLGSGTTAVACIKTGRKCIGIELSEDYCKIAARRCEEAFDAQGLYRQEETVSNHQTLLETAP